MASVRPLHAWLPPEDRAAAIASVPYDVIDSREARALVEGKPDSFLHVIRPEVDLEAGIDLYSDPVYAKAAENLDRWIQRMPYTPTPEPALFVYRLIRADHTQIGVVGACSVDEYDAGRIAIHEKTRQNKEDDRTRHVVTMRCQAEPIFLAYRGQEAIDGTVAEIVRGTPRFDFVAEDGVQHTLWDVPEPDRLSALFEAVPMLYVADGHHRAKSASRARAELVARAEARGEEITGEESFHRVLAVVFPDDQLAILPYNRVVTDLGGRTPQEALDAIAAIAPLTPTDDPAPPSHHDIVVYGAGQWHRFTLAPTGDGAVDTLDVTLLQEQVLEPLFGIADPRTDDRIDFVGGIRGTAELERRADECHGLAFSMFPTSMAELFSVADSGAIMPPKSTWFEPKLRSGMFLHRI